MTIDVANLRPKEREIYLKAEELLEQGIDAPTFSSRFFGPGSELTKLGTERDERQRILGSDLYRWLKGRYAELRLRGAAAFEQETRAAASRLTVALPKSLHSALKSEAASEGVSLSELIRLKLAIPYVQMTELLMRREPPRHRRLRTPRPSTR